ncbi:MAG: hypothetical protein H6835_15585 [Planctomycetes bacterium]|nr:hypothetical protein [Planctomycetota bacterium]
MRYFRIMLTAASWALLAWLLLLVGHVLGFMVLRQFELRPLRSPPDWLDSAVGIALLLVVPAVLLWLRIRLHRNRVVAAQHVAVRWSSTSSAAGRA